MKMLLISTNSRKITCTPTDCCLRHIVVSVQSYKMSKGADVSLNLLQFTSLNIKK